MPRAIAYILTGWDLGSWRQAMRELDPSMDIRSYPDAMGRCEDIAYALAWRPPPDGAAAQSRRDRYAPRRDGEGTWMSA